MKLHLSSSILLLALASSTFASQPTMMPVAVSSPGSLYLGIFAGGGASNNFNATQYATAFFLEAAGGALAVNGFAQLNNHSAFFYGVQLGYQAQEICLNSCSQWTITPAAELEGYFMNKRSFDGDYKNNTDRLPEHDFAVSYPTKRNVYLTNAVISFNNPCWVVEPYIGFGIGGAILQISDATATQISPAEAANHYSANSSDTSATFAGQIKLGLNYDVYKCLSVFAEYRWLYIANSQFVFGSTVYPGHVPTTSWQVNLNPQKYNLGNIGIRLNW
jgi:opacity protein-like surface antigen